VVACMLLFGVSLIQDVSEVGETVLLPCPWTRLPVFPMLCVPGDGAISATAASDCRFALTSTTSLRVYLTSTATALRRQCPDDQPLVRDFIRRRVTKEYTQTPVDETGSRTRPRCVRRTLRHVRRCWLDHAMSNSVGEYGVTTSRSQTHQELSSLSCTKAAQLIPDTLPGSILKDCLTKLF
jgi:hypothetical protein